jgi:hypothetical protein
MGLQTLRPRVSMGKLSTAAMPPKVADSVLLVATMDGASRSCAS